MGVDAGATRGIGNGVDLIAVAEEIERGEDEADLSPEPGDEKFAATGGLDGCAERIFLSCVDGGAIDGVEIG